MILRWVRQFTHKRRMARLFREYDRVVYWRGRSRVPNNIWEAARFSIDAPKDRVWNQTRK